MNMRKDQPPKLSEQDCIQSLSIPLPASVSRLIQAGHLKDCLLYTSNAVHESGQRHNTHQDQQNGADFHRISDLSLIHI